MSYNYLAPPKHSHHACWRQIPGLVRSMASAWATDIQTRDSFLDDWWLLTPFIAGSTLQYSQSFADLIHSFKPEHWCSLECFADASLDSSLHNSFWCWKGFLMASNTTIFIRQISSLDSAKAKGKSNNFALSCGVQLILYQHVYI